jgi:SAM-dependent methyltransferase
MERHLRNPSHSSSASQLHEVVNTWSLSQNRHCLDLRPSESYVKRHLIPSTSIPLETLEQRFSQLPPRTSNVPFLLVVESNAQFNGQSPGDLLRARGWSVLEVLELPNVDDDTEEEFWEYVRTIGLLGTGNEGSELLFRPSTVLGDWVERIEETLTRVDGTVLDIGCGSGRDMGYLASRDFPWFVTGLDNWEQALKRAEFMVTSINVNRFRNVIYAKVDDSGAVLPLSPWAESILQNMEPFSLVLVIRYFPRSLFKKIHQFVQPGGYLIFSHFTTPPPPKNDYMSPPQGKRVQPGEVEELLRSSCREWAILQANYSECEDGRTVWDVVARLVG